MKLYICLFITATLCIGSGPHTEALYHAPGAGFDRASLSMGMPSLFFQQLSTYGTGALPLLKASCSTGRAYLRGCKR